MTAEIDPLIVVIAMICLLSAVRFFFRGIFALWLFTIGRIINAGINDFYQFVGPPNDVRKIRYNIKDQEDDKKDAKKGRRNLMFLVWFAILIFLLAGLVLSIIN